MTDRLVSTFADYRSWLEVYSFDGGFDLTEYVTPDGGRQQSSIVSNQPIPRKMRYAERLAQKRTCRHCRGPLHQPDVNSTAFMPPDDTRREDFNDTDVWLCGECGWWFLRRCWGWRLDEYQAGIYNTGTAEGILNRFSISADDLPLAALRYHLSKHVLDVNLVDPRKFEGLVQAIYRDFYQCDVRHVGGPGDNGIDLWAVIRDEPTIIQTKRRNKPGAVESVVLVRELVGTLILNGAKRGHLVTTADHFSSAAERESQSPLLREYGIEISLASRDDLYAMLLISNKQLAGVWDSVKFDRV